MSDESIEKNQFGNVLDKLSSIFIKDQPAAAVEKVACFLDAASDLVNYFADQVAQDAQRRDSTSAINGKGLLHTLQVILNCALNEPEDLAKHYAKFATSVLEAVKKESELEPLKSDRRFKDKLWRNSSFYRTLLQIYLAWNQHMQAWIEEQEVNDNDKRRIQFILEQMAAAFAPSNLPINPAALRRAERSGGMSAVKGLRNLIEDIQTNNGMPRQIKVDAYKVGVDLATTPGKVVFRNEILELIQYAPQADKVHRRPTLLIPPQINKYYVFDLKPRNSFLGHALQAGFQVFTISWCNAKDISPEWGIDAYVAAVLDAIEAIRAIAGCRSINVMSACAGGFTTLALMGYLAETNKRMIRSHSLFVTAVLSDRGSILELLATPEMADMARLHSQSDGTMDGKALGHVFAWLRPNDLVWNYWVNNNLMGREPPPLDVLYWDNDSTRLPAALHSDFLDICENAVFESKNRHSILGVPIDYGKVCVDSYFTAGVDDYLMPWPAVYRSARFFRGNHRFVLSDSGHVQSLLRPPQLAKTLYFTNDDIPATADEWLASARQHNGTWWFDWYAWLAGNSGALKRAPRRLGNRQYPPIMDAPGEYATQRL